MREVAKAAGVSLSALEIEITETAVLADPAHAAEVATRLRDEGVTIALDDFGTGYSSLTHLRELPIDRVKIDRSLVASCLTDRSASVILVAVAQLAHDLRCCRRLRRPENDLGVECTRRTARVRCPWSDVEGSA